MFQTTNEMNMKHPALDPPDSSPVARAIGSCMGRPCMAKDKKVIVFGSVICFSPCCWSSCWLWILSIGPEKRLFKKGKQNRHSWSLVSWGKVVYFYVIFLFWCPATGKRWVEYPQNTCLGIQLGEQESWSYDFWITLLSMSHAISVHNISWRVDTFGNLEIKDIPKYCVYI